MSPLKEIHTNSKGFSQSVAPHEDETYFKVITIYTYLIIFNRYLNGIYVNIGSIIEIIN